MPKLDKTIPLPPTDASNALSDHLGDNPFQGPPVVRGARKMFKDEAWTMQQRRIMESTFAYSRANDPCVVMNFNPFPLNVNGGYVMRERVPACKPEEPFTWIVIKDVVWTTSDEGAGLDNIPHFRPWPVHPSERAAEFVRAYTMEEMAGGVVAFFGTHIPRDLDVAVQVPVMNMSTDEVVQRIDRTERNLQEMIEHAVGFRNESLIRRLEVAAGRYTQEETRGWITDNDRNDGRFAHAIGLLDELPAFCLKKNVIQGAKTIEPKVCKSCGASNKPDALMCVCSFYVFDVVGAYREGIIPFGHVSMDRATEDELTQILEIKGQRDKIAQKLKIKE